MADDLATIVDAARTRAFVGRAAELKCFDAALAGRAPYRVLFVHGAGGLGKSALVHQFRVRAEAAGRRVVRVDGEDVDGSREGLQTAVSPVRTPISGAGPVLLVDGYERLAAMDGWVRDELVASLPAGVVVVLAGRNPPEPPWRTDPGWRSVVECLPMNVLDRAESERLLEHAGVPDGRRARLAGMGRGHPLTLAMLADAAVSGELPEDLADAPDLVAALATRLVDEAPDDDHALAMALCAHTWLTTQDLVEELLGRRAPEVWAWLETRPWVTRGTYGVYPHDLVREVLDADLRRRSPATYRRVNRALHQHSWTALRSGDEGERRLWAHQKLFLHRRSPLAESFWTMRERGTGIVTPGRAEHHSAVLEIVEKFEGPETADLAARWLAAQPENLSVVPSTTGVDAFAIHTMHPAAPALVDGTPSFRSPWTPLRAPRPPAPASRSTSPASSAARPEPARPVRRGRRVGELDAAVDHPPVGLGVRGHNRPRLLGTGVPVPRAHHRAPRRVRRPPLHAVRRGWRRLTPEIWFDLLGERELTGEMGPAPEHMLLPPPLSRERFSESLRAALHDLHQPDRLRASALMGSRLAMDLDGVSPTKLRATILAGIDHVAREPRGESPGRVLDRTYVHAAPTQEAAAAVLDLPFSTYRRHLAGRTSG